MDVSARPPQGRDIPCDFSDITTVPVTDIDWTDGGKLRVSFDGDLTAAQKMRVRLRITAANDAEEQAAVAAAGFLDITSPSLLDVVTQVRRLTRLVLTLDDGA